MIHILFSAPFLLPPALAVPPPQDAAAPPPKISWFQGTLEGALGEGREQKKVTLAYFGPAADELTAAMLRVTFADPRVVAALANVICVRVDPASLTPYASRIPIRSYPVTVWYNPDATARERTEGAHEPEPFLAETARILADIGTINEARRKAVERKDDIDAHFELYLRLKSVGDLAGMSVEREEVMRLDPEGRSRARMRFRYEEITNAIEAHWAEKQVLLMPKIEELRLFVEMQDDPEVTWDGWMRLANTHEYLAKQVDENSPEAKKHRATRRDCLARAWRAIPQYREYVRTWCYQYAELFWNQHQELSEEDKAFFATLTARMVQMFDQEAPAWALRARALMLKGQTAEALAAAEKAVELAPDQPAFKDLVRDIRSR